MHLEQSPPRILLIESHDALRAELVNTLSHLGYGVTAFADVLSAQSCGLGLDASNPMLRVIDSSAEGAREWLVEPTAEALSTCRTLVLVKAENKEAARWISLGYSVLYKPFSLQGLERRIVELLSPRSFHATPPLDPLLVSEEPELLGTLAKAEKWAARPFSICIEGEIGTGRRALARMIHDWGRAPLRPFQMIERSSVESAPASQVGPLIEEALVGAQGGSVAFVEPDEWPAYAGERLTSALRSFRDEAQPRYLVIAKQSLPESVREGRLPVELQYRLDAAQLALPPIRERVRDQPALCRAILRRVARELGMETPEIDEEVIALLQEEGFPGNRLGLESRLRNLLVRTGEGESLLSVMRAAGETHSETPGASAGPASLNLKSLERETIIRALAHWQGNRTRASETLGISVRTLRNKIREYGLR